MIKPCSTPLKINPFTSYRDPDTGRWIVVTAVQNPCESNLKAKAEAEEKGKVEASSSASPTVSLPPKFLSFSLPSKKSVKKSPVAVS
ncbi:MAG: hypothetical protein WCD53_10700 [Microcoleus sp.]